MGATNSHLPARWMNNSNAIALIPVERSNAFIELFHLLMNVRKEAVALRHAKKYLFGQIARLFNITRHLKLNN